jgi:hypothetical protein
MSNEEILQYHLNSGSYKKREEAFKARDLSTFLEFATEKEAEYRKESCYFISKMMINTEYIIMYYDIWELRNHN